ncbi:MAG TPA: WG repeat-containing protein [Candidatus Dormibacteraeota bacterium]|nr:WG repeat-containing protein [Candidatus Dormibacteraeota bacterium]
MAQNRTQLAISTCVGGIVGVLIVRAFFLGPFEELGWRMFWEAVGEGRSIDLGMVVQSATFAKCLAGLVLGAGAGFYVSSTFNRKLGAPRMTGIGSTGMPQTQAPQQMTNYLRLILKSVFGFRNQRMISPHSVMQVWKEGGIKAKVIVIAVVAAMVIGTGLYFGVADSILYSDSKKETPRLFAVCDRCATKDRRWGYIDSTGKLVINSQFEEVADFSEGLAAVKTGSRWGFIDEDGKFVINPQFDEVSSFAEGLAAVKSDGKWGYVDKTGKYTINPQFYDAAMFSEGLAPVFGTETGFKHGYIDRSGKNVINAQFDDVRCFFEGRAAVKLGDKWGYINRRGKYIINPQFDEASDAFSEGRAAFKIGDKWGYIDEDGKYVVNPQFDSAGKFSEGLAVVQSGEKWGYVDLKGNFAISPQFAKAEDFSEGFAAVKLGDQWGYIDNTGKIVISPRFNGSSVGAFRRGLAPIAPNLYINAKAEWVFPSVKTFQSDFAQMEPLLNANRPSSDENDGRWNLCANNIATRPLCFTLRKGDATEYGKALFHDRKAAQTAAKLQFDELAFEDGHGRTLFAMKPTADGWVPFPGVPTQPFMLETVPDLPSLPNAESGENGTPVTPVSAESTEQ